jgi:uncharacterized protein (DUF1330 family)
MAYILSILLGGGRGGQRRAEGKRHATIAVTLCVLLSAVPGNEQLLIDYEDRVLELLAAHGGRVLRRVRAIDARSAPFEVQLIEFPSEAALERFMSDPARAAMSGLRDRAVAASKVVRVEVVPAEP